MNPKEIIDYIESKLISNVIPLDVEPVAIQLIEEYAQSYYENKIKNIPSVTELINKKYCPKCNSTNVIMFDSDNDLCNDCNNII